MRAELPVTWRREPLSELVSRPVTYGIVKPGPEGQIPLVRATDLVDGRVIESNLRTVGAEVDRAYARTRTQPGDMLVALVGKPGAVALVSKTLAGANINRAVGLVRLDPSRCLPEYAYYFFQGEGGRRVSQAVVGSVQQVLNLKDLARIEVDLPPRREQEPISSLLSTLDKKIDSNRRLAALVAETAADAFRRRFVDSVGVKTLADSGNAPVPAGWRTDALFALADFVNGRAFTKHANGQGRPIIRIKELKAGVSETTPRSDLEVRGEHIARERDILFAWSGSLDVYRWTGPEALINQHIFKVIPRGYPPWFVYGWLREHMPEFQAIARDKATTMGHIQRRHLAEAAVPIPDAETLAAAAALLDPLDNHQLSLIAESATLTALRDALLPRLISGEIRVPDTTDSAEVIEPAAEDLAATP